MKTLASIQVLAFGLALAAPAAADGVRVQNKDRDRDVRVSTTRTTSAVAPVRRDVVESRAEERRDLQGDRWTAAPLIGGATNGLGFGAGARLGYTLPTPIYIGANYMYHTGSDADARSYAHYPSGELGYDIGAGPMLIRPYAGLGVLFRGGNGANTNTGLVYPGVTVHYLISRSAAFVGADARVLMPIDATPAFAAAGTAGVNF